MALPTGGAKRKSTRTSVQEGAKRLRSYLRPPSPDAGSSSAPSSASVSPGPLSRSVSPGPPSLSQLPSTQHDDTASRVTRTGLAMTDVQAQPGTSKPAIVTTSGLASLLETLHINPGLTHPLKPAISGLIGCLDFAAATSATEYDELMSELNSIARALKGYIDELGFEDLSNNASCTLIALSIQKEVTHIERQQNRSGIRRAAESLNDRDDVIQCCRRVEGMFRQLQNEISLQSLRHTNKQQLLTLHGHMAPVDDARYNSSYSTTVERRSCTKETREQVQADLQGWVQNPNGAKVYWMNGMAGTGKTTIAYSLCEWLTAKQQLGASFFCSRASPSCRNVNLIIPTVAYEIARYFPSFRSTLCKALEQDPGASRLNVVQQFEKLLRAPLAALPAKSQLPAGVVIVIDALDECEGEAGVRLVLQVLLRLATHLPLKFFVTSRPEPIIRDRMLSTSGYPPTVLHLHDIEQSIIEGDIKKYLAEELQLMLPQPSERQVQRLAKLAGKLFIYAATVTRYILPGTAAVDSMARLNAILEASYRIVNQSGSAKKYQQLDELYTTVLVKVLDERILEQHELEPMRLVLWTVVCAKEPMTIATLASFLSLAEEHVLSILKPLRSVLHVSERGRLVSTFHASFPDYIHDRQRSNQFWCDRTRHEELIANRCFDVMKRQLRFNICRLESSFVLDEDVADLPQRINNNISPTLSYACLYWGDHLALATGSIGKPLLTKLVNFLTDKLLFWMEVLNVKQCVVKGISTLSQAEKWLMSIKAEAGIQRLAFDANDFVARFAGGACSRSTPHIYISALPFCEKSSSVYEYYYSRMRGLVDLQGTVATCNNTAAQAAWATNDQVFSLGLTVDGTRLVSGGVSGAIYVRDAHTGEVIAGPLHGHTASISSVAFSPDGTRIVSGSEDRTIQVWDAYAGDIVAGPLRGHTDWIISVTFSPDGTRIASGSADQTIRIWDARTGAPVIGPLEGHKSWVKSVAFSPDGRLVASGSWDRTIRVWDADTGDAIGSPFLGHEESVNSVAFSPDGAKIVSGSGATDSTTAVWELQTRTRLADIPSRGHTSSINPLLFDTQGARFPFNPGAFDCSVRVWDVQTGQVVAGPFRGHSSSVNAVAFSPDGERVVSGSSDQTLQVWNLNTGHVVAGPFHEHIGPVNSVAFSHSGARVFSGSSDRTIRVWASRANNFNTSGSPPGHTYSINSVTFSPDGTFIISGSADRTVRVWNARTADIIAGPLEGHTQWVKSTAISRDMKYIVSGSWDRTIRVWNGCTGDVVAGPFTGHTESVNSVAFSPDSTHIVSGSDDRTIRVWSVRTGEVVARVFSGLTSAVNSVAFSPDGTRIVSGSHNSSVQVWDANTGEIAMRPIQGHSKRVNSVTFSPDGECIASGSADKTIRLWDSRTGDAIAEPIRGHTGSVNSVAFSPDGTRIVSGSDDQTVCVWNTATGLLVVGPFRGHKYPVNSVAFSPDGTCVVSGSNDQVIRIWDVSSFRDFRSMKDGWFIENNRPTFWVPPDLHPHIPHPNNTLLIGPRGSSLIDYQGLHLGDQWANCYAA